MPFKTATPLKRHRWVWSHRWSARSRSTIKRSSAGTFTRRLPTGSMSTPVVIPDQGDGVAERANAGPKTWFITGASKGLGRQWTIAALERGDRVAVAARSVDLLEELASEYGRAVLPIALDVRDREAAFAAVAQA